MSANSHPMQCARRRGGWCIDGLRRKSSFHNRRCQNCRTRATIVVVIVAFIYFHRLELPHFYRVIWTKPKPNRAETKQKKEQLICVSVVVLNCSWTMFCAQNARGSKSSGLFKRLNLYRYRYTRIHVLISYKTCANSAHALAHEYFNQNPFFLHFQESIRFIRFSPIFVFGCLCECVCCFFLSFFVLLLIRFASIPITSPLHRINTHTYRNA